MKCGPCIWTLVWLAGCHSAFAGESHLRFVNGDKVTGRLVSFGPEEMIWESDLFESPAVFETSKVLDFMLPAKLPANRDAKHEATVTMTNGDKIIGQLVEVTEKVVLLDTWYAGRLSMNRLMVEDVAVDDAGQLIYRGPNSLEGWTVTPKDSWGYDRFVFSSTGDGAIAKDDVLQDECSVSFDLEWESDSLKFKTALFTDRMDSRSPRSGYELSIQRSSIFLRSLSKQNFLGNTHSAQISRTNDASIEIRASRTKGTVALLIDGELIEVWQDDNAATSSFGDGLHFLSDDQSPVSISKIRVSEWDGTISEPRPMRREFGRGWGMPNQMQINPEADEKKEDEGMMKLANGDAVDGKVTAIRDGQVELETSLGKMTIPVERLRTVVLPPAPREEAFIENPDVRATLSDGASIVFRLDDADDETVSGSSQNFGDVVFRRDAFQAIEFNIHYPEFRELNVRRRQR